MSWQTELPIIVRTLINDLNDPPVYSDDRLLQVISVAAKYVQFDVTLEHSYDVNVANSSISPDPIDDRDEIFIALVCLKASCIIDQSTFRTKSAMEGIRAALGPASLSVNGGATAWRTMLELGPCAAYDELTSHWDVAQATNAKAILSPFIGNKFDPRSVNANSSYWNWNGKDMFR